jgi:hypothetical protein
MLFYPLFTVLFLIEMGASLKTHENKDHNVTKAAFHYPLVPEAERVQDADSKIA